MTRTVKGLLLGCALLVFLGVILIVALRWYVKHGAPDVSARARAAKADAALFGKDLSESQCVAIVWERYPADPDSTTALIMGSWLDGCLETSHVEISFCDGVPAETDERGAAAWRVARCAEAGIPQDTSCPNVIGRVEHYCGSEARRTKLALAFTPVGR